MYHLACEHPQYPVIESLILTIYQRVSGLFSNWRVSYIFLVIFAEMIWKKQRTEGRRHHQMQSHRLVQAIQARLDRTDLYLSRVQRKPQQNKVNPPLLLTQSTKKEANLR